MNKFRSRAMSDSVHFKLTHNGKTKRFALVRTDDPLRIEELFATVRQRVAIIVGSPPHMIDLAWKDVNSASISPPSIPLTTPRDLQRAIEFIMHFDGLDEQAKNRPLCLHLDVKFTSEEEESFARCSHCTAGLHPTSPHLQCPYKSTHSFCMDCTKTNLWQQHTKKEMNCPSGEKCLINGTIKSWSFTEEMLKECLGNKFEEFMEKRNSARTAFVFAVAAAVGKRLRAEALRESPKCEEPEDDSVTSNSKSRENAVPGTAVRDIVKDTEEKLPNSSIVPLDKSDSTPVKTEEKNIVLSEAVDNSLETKAQAEAKSGTTKTLMSELKAEPVIDDPLRCRLSDEDDTPAPSKSNAMTLKADEEEEMKSRPAELQSNVAKKSRTTVAQKIATTKSSKSATPAEYDDSPEAELKEAMRDFLKTAASDAVETVVDARSALIEAARSGLKEFFMPVQTETTERAKVSKDDTEKIKVDKPAVDSKKKVCGNTCEDCDELKKRISALEKELMGKKEDQEMGIEELKRSSKITMEGRLHCSID